MHSFLFRFDFVIRYLIISAILFNLWPASVAIAAPPAQDPQPTPPSPIMYYGQGDGSFTVTATAGDNLAGIATVELPDLTSSGATYTTDGTHIHTYTFQATDTLSGTFPVLATDRAGNVITGSLTLIKDTTPPGASITVPPISGLAVNVTWNGFDGEAGLRNYDVEYKDSENVTWTSWLTEVSYTDATFVGTKGYSYTFRIRATDNVNNTSDWLESSPVEVSSVTKYYTFNGERVAMRKGDDLFYLHGDHLGSTSLITDEEGNVVAETRYLPYGQERWTNGDGVTDFGFTNQRKEAGFGLMDYNARYYNPTIGRFISPDPIVPNPVDGQTFNRYAYVNNNPMRYTDSSGHCIDGISTWVCVGIVLGVTALVVNASEPLHESEFENLSYIRNPTSGIGCTASLAECHKAGVLKEFKDNEQINAEEFNEMMDIVAEEVYFGWTPPVDDPIPSNTADKYWEYGPGGVAGRGRYDTPFYNGGGQPGVVPPYSSDQPVCFGNECYGRSEVNYVAQGMWGAASGETWQDVETIIQFWNQENYNHPASDGELFWAKQGYDHYNGWLENKEKEWMGGN